MNNKGIKSDKKNRNYIYNSVAFLCMVGTEFSASAAQPNFLPGDPLDVDIFLSDLYSLVKTPPITAQKITHTFGWKLLDTGIERTGYYKFEVYKEVLWTNPYFSSNENTKKSKFQMQMQKSNICIVADDLIGKFGLDFTPVRAVIFHPYPDVNDYPEAVKANQKRFGYGLNYNFESSLDKVGLFLNFNFSKCMESLSIISEAKKGEKNE